MINPLECLFGIEGPVVLVRNRIQYPTLAIDPR